MAIKLSAISQRDANFYDFMADNSTQQKLVEAIVKFWRYKIVEKWYVEDCKFSLFSLLQIIFNILFSLKMYWTS